MNDVNSWESFLSFTVVFSDLLLWFAAVGHRRRQLISTHYAVIRTMNNDMSSDRSWTVLSVRLIKWDTIKTKVLINSIFYTVESTAPQIYQTICFLNICIHSVKSKFNFLFVLFAYYAVSNSPTKPHIFISYLTQETAKLLCWVIVLHPHTHTHTLLSAGSIVNVSSRPAEPWTLQTLSSCGCEERDKVTPGKQEVHSRMMS